MSALVVVLAMVPGTAPAAAGRDGGTPASSGSVEIRVSVAARVAVRPLTGSVGTAETSRPCLASNGAPLPLPVEMLLLDAGTAVPSGPEVDHSKDGARFTIRACDGDPQGSAGPAAGHWPEGSGLILIRPD